MLDGERVEVEAGQAPAVFAPAGDKGDMRAIRRPCRVAVVPVALGQLMRLASCRIDEKEVLAAVMDRANGIRTIEEPIDNAHFGQRLAVFGFFIEWRNR